MLELSGIAHYLSRGSSCGSGPNPSTARLHCECELECTGVFKNKTVGLCRGCPPLFHSCVCMWWWGRSSGEQLSRLAPEKTTGEGTDNDLKVILCVFSPIVPALEMLPLYPPQPPQSQTPRLLLVIIRYQWLSCFTTSLPV